MQKPGRGLPITRDMAALSRRLALYLVAAVATWTVLDRAAPGPHPILAQSVDGADYRLDATVAHAAGSRDLSPEVRAAGLRFDPAVASADRQAILDAVATARPEARRLIELVDGLTTVSVGAAGEGAAGRARWTPDGYDVVLDLGLVAPQLGERGVRRLVLHELAHVVDFALVTDALRTALDAGIPRGWECEGGNTGACSGVEERFAESFAKWAMSDIGVDLYIGYKVPPPGHGLDAWGEPLARLGT